MVTNKTQLFLVRDWPRVSLTQIKRQSKLLLRVNSPRSPGVPSMSEAEGRPDLPRPWPELRLLAKSRSQQMANFFGSVSIQTDAITGN